MGKHCQASKFLPLLVAAAPLLSPLACGSSETPSADSGLPNGVFGGASGIMEAVPAGTTSLGSAGAQPAVPADVCAVVPQGTRALIDDFEDGDSVAVPEGDREAYWFTVHDDSAGSIDPDTNFLPVSGGAHGSAWAAHITASGYSTWGAGFSANISHLAAGIRCPYNATRFSGLRFYARGTSNVRVELMVPEVVALEYGGKCDASAGQTCYDTHGVEVVLTPEWKLYSFPWSQFVQRGFGTAASFRPEAIMTLQYAFELADLPADVWVDDVSFEDGSPTPQDGAGGEGGASNAPPGASGAGGEAGGASSAGQRGS